MNKKTLLRAIGGPRTASCPQFGAIYFQHLIQICSILCIGYYTCQIYCDNFQIVQALHMAFIGGLLKLWCALRS